MIWNVLFGINKKRYLQNAPVSNCQGTLKQIFLLKTQNSRSTQKQLSRVHPCEIRLTGTVRETRFIGML